MPHRPAGAVGVCGKTAAVAEPCRGGCDFAVEFRFEQAVADVDRAVRPGRVQPEEQPAVGAGPGGIFGLVAVSFGARRIDRKIAGICAAAAAQTVCDPFFFELKFGFVSYVTQRASAASPENGACGIGPEIRRAEERRHSPVPERTAGLEDPDRGNIARSRTGHEHDVTAGPGAVPDPSDAEAFVGDIRYFKFDFVVLLHGDHHAFS